MNRKVGSWSLDVKDYVVRPSRNDIAKFQAQADRGDFPSHAVRPLAAVYAAARRAQSHIGPGHKPLDALLDALPEAYVINWLNKRFGKQLSAQ